MSADFVIAIPVYPRVDLMDVATPYEIFQWMAAQWSDRQVQVLLVAEEQKPVVTRDGLELSPHRTFDLVPSVDLLWIPGGDPDALLAQMANACYVEFIRSRAASAQFVTSVCEGALIAANAGLLDGFKVTTHWAFIECLTTAYPKVKVERDHPRFVHDRNRVTGGGISSGLDEALYLVKLIAGEEVAESVQVTLQYFPKPPVSGQIPGPSPCPLAGKLPVQIPPPRVQR
jgi:transcriptional regulator GlxA family with amidase domain